MLFDAHMAHDSQAFQEDLNEEQTSIRRESLHPFDVEVIAVDPLRVYVFTSTQEAFQQVKEVFAELKDQISPYSFVELEEKDGILQGVYARNLDRIFYGDTVKMIGEAAYQKQNSFEREEVSSHLYREDTSFHA